MKINLTLLEKLIGILLVLLQQINRLLENKEANDSRQLSKDKALADDVRSKFPNINDQALLTKMASANEVDQIIDRV